MIVNVQVSEAFDGRVDPALLERAALAALAQEKAGDNSELTILIEGDEAVKSLNRDYRGLDEPTDVLSFPAEEEDPETGNFYYGDIIISLPRALQQAETSGHPVEAELQLLVVHGVLHLLGMDHAEPDEKATMWAAQRGVLEQLGVQLARWPEE